LIWVREGQLLDPTLQWQIVGRLALAAVLGAVIGLEREYRGYPAGVRTTALVCMGAALFTDTSSVLGGDPSRLASNIVTGIGFLGAGLIFREGYSVRGVTTAATIWATAAVGIAVGAQAYIVAIAGALFTAMLLELRMVTKNIRPAAIHQDTDGNGNDRGDE
jgi:putative Mg2+ transporter-C (MgtC) family protein